MPSSHTILVEEYRYHTSNFIEQKENIIITPYIKNLMEELVMTTKLELRFKTSEGKSKMIGVSQPVLNLDSAVVEAAMKTIVDQNMLKKKM